MINFPVKIGVSSKVESYCKTLTNDEKQLLVCTDSKEFFVTNGQGGYIKMVAVSNNGNGSGISQDELNQLLGEYLKTEDLEDHLTDFVTNEALESAITEKLDAKLVEAVVKEAKTLTGLTATAEKLNEAVTKIHEHANLEPLSKITLSDQQKLLYDNRPLLESVDTSALRIEIKSLDTF